MIEGMDRTEKNEGTYRKSKKTLKLTSKNSARMERKRALRYSESMTIVFHETLTPAYDDFTTLIRGLTMKSFADESIVDEAYLRDYIVGKVKKIALTKGFRIKMPYADRLDKLKTRTINFYCHMSKSANRKLGASSQGCQFRVIYKLKSIVTLNDI